MNSGSNDPVVFYSEIGFVKEIMPYVTRLREKGVSEVRIQGGLEILHGSNEFNVRFSTEPDRAFYEALGSEAPTRTVFQDKDWTSLSRRNADQAEYLGNSVDLLIASFKTRSPEYLKPERSGDDILLRLR